MNNITRTDIRRAAMDLLARREHARGELITKLEQRFARSKREPEDQTLPLAEQIGEEVQRLAEQGLQSDQRMAEMFLRSRASRGQGPVKIRAEMRQKGLSDAHIAAGFEACDVDWHDMAQDVARKKFGDGPLEAKDRARQQRFLQGRGFSFDHINAVE